jgi:hypothetical protein
MLRGPIGLSRGRGDAWCHRGRSSARAFCGDVGRKAREYGRSPRNWAMASPTTPLSRRFIASAFPSSRLTAARPADGTQPARVPPIDPYTHRAPPGGSGKGRRRKTESQLFHRQRYREAAQAVGKIGSHVLEWAVCREIALEQVGQTLGWSSRPQAYAAAVERMKTALDELCKLWGDWALKPRNAALAVGTAWVGTCVVEVDSGMGRMRLLRRQLEFGTPISAAGPTL